MMDCLTRPSLAWCLTLPLFLSPAALSAQTVVDLPRRDQPVMVEAQDLYSVGSLAGEEWETFSMVSGVAFDGAGNLYILDTQNYRVVKVDHEGNFLSEMGRGGDGPGEFGMPLAFSVTQDGEVRVYDLGKQGFALFNPDGSFKTTVPMGGEGMFMPTGRLLPHPDGGVISGGAGGMRISMGGGPGEDPTTRQLQLFEMGDEVEVTTIYEGWNPAIASGPSRAQTTSTGDFQLSAPPMRAFDPDLMTGILPDGRVALVDSTTYEVKIVELNRGVTMRFRRPIEPRPVTRRDQEEERDRQLEEMAQREASGGAGSFYVMGGGGGGESQRISSPSITTMLEERIQNMEFGEEMPVIGGLWADWEGHIWLGRLGRRVGEEGPVDLITSEGQYLGTMEAEEFQMPDAFGPNGLAAWIETDEFDVPTIMVRRLIIR
jgi:hypothetical protein